MYSQVTAGARNRSGRARGLLVMFLVVPLLLAGCKFKDQIKAQILQTVPQGFAESTVTIGEGELEGTFTADGQVKSLKCSYTISGEVNGKPVTKTVTIALEAKGDKGDKFKLRCDDPLIAQFPSDAHAFHAAARKGSATVILHVTSGLHVLAISRHQHLRAAPGHQLVLIALPARMKGTFMVGLAFKLASSRGFPVTALMAGQVTCHHGAVFYPPVAPLAAKISAGLVIMLPVAPVPVPLPPVNIASVHNGKTLVDCR